MAAVELNIDVTVPVDDCNEALFRMVENYNRKVERYGGYSPIEYDPTSRRLTCHFIPKQENGLGVVKGVKHSFQNGDLFEDLERILMLANPE